MKNYTNRLDLLDYLPIFCVSQEQKEKDLEKDSNEESTVKEKELYKPDFVKRKKKPRKEIKLKYARATGTDGQ